MLRVRGLYSLGATLWGGNNFSILTKFHKFPTNSIKYKSARRRRVNQALLPPPHEIRGERRWRCFWQTCAKAPFRATACQKKRHVLRPCISWGVRTRAWLTPRRRALLYLCASLRSPCRADCRVCCRVHCRVDYTATTWGCISALQMNLG